MVGKPQVILGPHTTSELAQSPEKSYRHVGNGDSHLRIIPFSGLTKGERRSPEDMDVALIADIGCNLLDDPRNLVITEFGRVQFEAPALNILEIKPLSAD
jgi:hypothetical protein